MLKAIKEMNYADNDVALYVVDIKEATTKTNSKYLRVTLRDTKKKEITCNYGGRSLENTELKVGEGYEFIVNRGTYNGNDSYTLVNVKTKLSDVSEYVSDMSGLAPTMDKYFNDVILSISDNKLKQFTTVMYEKMKEMGFLRSSAAQSMHHNYLSGLAYHTYGMVKVAESIAATDKRVNRDILVVGCLIHDAGKLVELVTDEKGNASYTAKGLLKGHLCIGEEIVSEVARGILEEDVAMQLSHIMLSHHGKLEWGSPVEPKTLEAFLVHQIDLIDSRKEMFCREYETIESGEVSDKRVIGLDNNFIYKP